jgi:hypothetical protein
MTSVHFLQRGPSKLPVLNTKNETDFSTQNEYLFNDANLTMLKTKNIKFIIGFWIFGLPSTAIAKPLQSFTC